MSKISKKNVVEDRRKIKRDDARASKGLTSVDPEPVAAPVADVAAPVADAAPVAMVKKGKKKK